MITDKKYRLAVISAACFFASFALTATVVKTIKVIGMRKSVGGFETSSVPEYTENLEALLSEGENSDFESSKLDSAESTITYQTYRVKPGDMIGFIAEKHNDKIYIQVTESMLSEETRQRELKPLMTIPDHYNKLVLSMDRDFIHFENGIRMMYLPDWLGG